MSRFDKIVSIGSECRSAYQIRRFTGTSEAYPFDWLVTPYAALLHILETDFEGFFQQKNLIPDDKRLGAADAQSGVLFLHDFPRDSGRVTAPLIAENYHSVKGKYDYLTPRWRALSEAASILFVRSIDGPECAPEPIRERLQAVFPKVRVNLLMVRGYPCERSEAGGIITDCALNDAGPYPDYWRGDDQNWDRILSAATQCHWTSTSVLT